MSTMEIEGTSVGIREPGPAAPAGYDAFISYRRSDERTATAVFELLELFGQRVFLDRRCIRLGQSWESTILVAARNTRTLLVLWSRSAAASSEMRREIHMVADQCRVIPIRLDMSPLPPELSAWQALEGLDVASRILARGRELVVQGKQSTADAMATIVRELRSDGVELTPEQRRRTRAYVGVLRRGMLAAGLGTALWFWSRASRAAVSGAGASALALGVAGVGLGHVTQREAPLQAECNPLLTTAAPVSVPAPAPPPPVNDPAPEHTAIDPADKARAELQRQLDGTTRQLAECQRDAKAKLSQCRDESRRAIAELSRPDEPEPVPPITEVNPTPPADDSALRACQAQQAELLERQKQDQAALTNSERQLQECRDTARPDVPSTVQPSPYEVNLKATPIRIQEEAEPSPPSTVR
jgi:hypothetical protein